VRWRFRPQRRECSTLSGSAYANAACNYNFKPGESGKLALEFWITPFDYSPCDGSQSAVESVFTEDDGHPLSNVTVARCLDALGYTRQATSKSSWAAISSRWPCPAIAARPAAWPT
jgi:hypothetical protein